MPIIRQANLALSLSTFNMDVRCGPWAGFAAESDIGGHELHNICCHRSKYACPCPPGATRRCCDALRLRSNILWVFFEQCLSVVAFGASAGGIGSLCCCCMHYAIAIAPLQSFTISFGSVLSTRRQCRLHLHLQEHGFLTSPLA